MKRKHQASSIVKSFSSKQKMDENIYLGNKLNSHSMSSSTKSLKKTKKEGCGCGKQPRKAI